MAVRRFGGAVLTAVWMIAILGCHPRAVEIADRCAELPANVQLPDGFYPLRDHYLINNADDNYNGWPRYIVSDRDNMIMCYVPAQQFTMGGGIGSDEVPAREVVVGHFYMDLHEVTNAQYDRFRKAAGERCWGAQLADPFKLFSSSKLDRYRGKGRPWIESEAYHTYPYEYVNREQGKQMLYPETALNFWFWQGQTPADIDYYLDYWQPGLNNNHPVRAVSWWEAMYYAKWTHKTLPTEAQWEAAARGGDRRLYPWGNNEVSDVTRYLCNARTGGGDLYDGYEYTAPVLSYAGGVSPFGVFNMSGNVWEWCVDWYDPGRFAYPSDEDPPSELQRGAVNFGDRHYPNPITKQVRETRVGPIRGDERTLRGGSFADPIEQCRTTSRMASRPDVHANNFGFRCILPLPEECH